MTAARGVRARLLAWYDGVARDLPWRRTNAGGGRDPYRSLVSEFMLQQTPMTLARAKQATCWWIGRGVLGVGDQKRPDETGRVMVKIQGSTRLARCCRR